MAREDAGGSPLAVSPGMPSLPKQGKKKLKTRKTALSKNGYRDCYRGKLGVGKLKSGENGYRDCYPMSSGDFPVTLVLIFVERRIGGDRVGQGERMVGAHGDASGPPLMVSPGMPSLPRSELIGENTSIPRFSNHKVENKMRPDRHGPAGAD